ncbi:MAG: hypothetical protein ABJB33_04565 [Gemmatimonadota bacterium]
MSALRDLPLPSLVRDETLSAAAVAAERAVLDSLARTGDGAAVRTQALVELMSLEATCGDELAFERLRHELLDLELPEPVATLYRVQVTWGLVRFGRLAAARRSAQ